MANGKISSTCGEYVGRVFQHGSDKWNKHAGSIRKTSTYSRKQTNQSRFEENFHLKAFSKLFKDVCSPSKPFAHACINIQTRDCMTQSWCGFIYPNTSKSKGKQDNNSGTVKIRSHASKRARAPQDALGLCNGFLRGPAITVRIWAEKILIIAQPAGTHHHFSSCANNGETNCGAIMPGVPEATWKTLSF